MHQDPSHNADDARLRDDPVPGLTVAVIHYRTPELVAPCLEALRRAAPEARIVLVDTSEDDLLEPVLDALADPPELLRVPNRSYAHAVNEALKRSRSPLFVQMNCDVFVEPDTLARLERVFADPRIGMAGPRVRDAEGRLQDQGLVYRLRQLALGASGRVSLAVPWLSGCLQMVRREAVETVGGMDASYRFYNDDLEWCYRLRRAGWRCVLVDAPVVHLGGASTPSQARFLIEGFRGGYVVARRYHPAPLRRLHRVAMLAASWLLARVARREHVRDAHRQIHLMFRHDRFDESPFGPTLADANPRFLTD